jgi:hypothetical protein
MDKWEPLICIADALGTEWGKTARAAALAMSGRCDEQGQTLGVLLLQDLRTMFAGADIKHESKYVCEELKKIEERPWAELVGNARKPITQHKLAALLKPFGVYPHSIRIGEVTAKGYETKDFADAWERYLNAEDTAKDGSPEASDDLHNETPAQSVTSRVPVRESDGFKKQIWRSL